MKTFIRAIIVFVVLNLAMGCFAMAQNAPGEGDLEAAKEEMKKAGQKIKESGQKMKETAQYDMAKRLEEAAQRREEAAQRRQEKLLRDLKVLNTRTLGMGRSRSLTDWHGGSGPVLVIPAAEIKAEDLVTIMEDMSVMSRILDKKLDLSPGGIFPGGYGGGGFGGGLNFSFFGSTGAGSTEAIFLQGYGALFLMKVNFPLSPPAEVEEEKIEEPADPIWEETKREIYAPEDVGRRRRAPAAKYDVEKVEDLKRKLIKALKHAANIRNLKPSESIIITVTGEGDQVSGTIRLLVKQSTIDADVKDREVKIYGAPFSDEMGFSSPMVLTIRVKKSDVDAFAKGEVDFEQFRKRVQIFTY